MLVKTAGVKHLVILINKMDDPTVKWEQKRYDYCKDQLTPYLKVSIINLFSDLNYCSIYAIELFYGLKVNSTSGKLPSIKGAFLLVGQGGVGGSKTKKKKFHCTLGDKNTNV